MPGLDVMLTGAPSSGGGVKRWSWNGYGQLGNGSTTHSTTPVNALLATQAVFLTNAWQTKVGTSGVNGTVHCRAI